MHFGKGMEHVGGRAWCAASALGAQTTDEKVGGGVMAREYNGYRSWDAFNVAWWLINDEGLHGQMVHCVKESKNQEQASRMLLAMLPDETPDGAKYSLRSIRKAMVGLRCGND